MDIARLGSSHILQHTGTKRYISAGMQCLVANRATEIYVKTMKPPFLIHVRYIYTRSPPPHCVYTQYTHLRQNRVVAGPAPSAHGAPSPVEEPQLDAVQRKRTHKRALGVVPASV